MEIEPPIEDESPPCLSCGSATAVWFSTPEGRARLCPPCATLHGLGCP
ncbi:MAG: hypothetical protein ACO225_00660 [Ilumatobacteraceae bacterium]